MKAAVIRSFAQPPTYANLDEPSPNSSDEMLVDVLAVGLHHLTFGRASGEHYSSGGGSRLGLPLVPGVDGVGRGSDGKLRYFVQGPRQMGTLAEKTVIALSHSITLPDDIDPIVVAAAMNPAMASWLALRCRTHFQAGQKVLVLGATGNSGNLAIQIAQHLGASQIIAAGRDVQKLAKLAALGATDAMPLGDASLGKCAREVDVVLDFIWGEASVRIMEAVLMQRSDPSSPLTWIHLGSMAGQIAPIPGSFLRAANFHIMGSGHGSVSERDILAELPALVKEIARGTFSIDVKSTPLSNVAQAWSEAAHTDARIVITP